MTLSEGIDCAVIAGLEGDYYRKPVQGKIPDVFCFGFCAACKGMARKVRQIVLHARLGRL